MRVRKHGSVFFILDGISTTPDLPGLMRKIHESFVMC